MRHLLKCMFCIILSFSLIAMSFTSVSAGKHSHDDVDAHFGFDGITIENINIDFDDDDLTVSNTDEKDSFTITKDYKLYVNDRFIETTPEQQLLVKEMYISIDEIIDEAKAIGWQGAKIGAEGVKLGLQAIIAVFKLLLPGYDADDLEDEMETKANKIEKKAEKIEKRAEEIEDMIRDLEKLSDKMRKDIPALQELKWF